MSKVKFNYNNALDTNFKITFPNHINSDLELNAVSANIPGITLQAINQNYKDIRVKLPDNLYDWDDITITFLMDEDLYTFELLYNWVKSVNHDNMDKTFHDIDILPLDGNKKLNYSFLYKKAWPTNISGWQYTTMGNDANAIMFDVTFAYQDFCIKRLKPLSIII